MMNTVVFSCHDRADGRKIGTELPIWFEASIVMSHA
jgi:hypothetical protein